MTTESKNIDDLRAVLFDAIAGVKAGTLALDKARAINDLGKTLVETAKVEVDYHRIAGSGESGFIEPKQVPGSPATPGVTSITQHRIGR